MQMSRIKKTWVAIRKGKEHRSRIGIWTERCTGIMKMKAIIHSMFRKSQKSLKLLDGDMTGIFANWALITFTSAFSQNYWDMER